MASSGCSTDREHDLCTVLFWGTYDLSKPRTRILLSGLKSTGTEVAECHASVWEHVRDKGVLSAAALAGHVGRALLAYPKLVADFLRLPARDAVFVGYLGQLDVLMLWPFARLRGVPIVWDQFISLYNTVVEDRRLVSSRHPLAALLYAWEWLACRAADCVLMDTQAHADYVVERFAVPASRVCSVWVGAESGQFPEAAPRARDQKDPFTVLFYGQFIRLHGIETIVRAAQMMKDEAVRFVLIGSGQEEDKIRALLEEDSPSQLTWLPWVEYEELFEWINRADVCLGIFGDTDKAARVIPNKVFQILSARRPLVTRDSPAIRELLDEQMPGVTLVPPADADALVAALRALRQATAQGPLPPLYADLRAKITPEGIGTNLRSVLEQVVTRHRASRESAARRG